MFWSSVVVGCLVGGMVDSASTGVLNHAEPAIGVVEKAAIQYVPADIADVRRGQRVRLTGTVSRILDRAEFRLADDSASIRVILPWAGPVLVNELDRVIVEGIVDDELSFGLPRPEVFASGLRLPCNTQIFFAPPSSQGDQTEAKPAASDLPEGVTPIADLQRGQAATIRGRVTRMLDTDEFRLEDDSGSVRVYIGWRNQMPVQQGDRVSVVGIVDSEGPGALFREVYAYTITMPNGRTVELQANRLAEAKPAPAPRDPAPNNAQDQNLTITPTAQVRRGQSVAVRGTVDRIRDTDEFVLRDDSGTIRIYIGWRNRMPVATGDRVTVIGVADDDVFPGLRPEIYANRIVLPSGQTVTLTRGSYDDYE